MTRATSSVVRAAPRQSRYGLRGVKGGDCRVVLLLYFGPESRTRTSRRALLVRLTSDFLLAISALPWAESTRLLSPKCPDYLSRSPSRKSIPGKYREVAEPAGGRGGLYVAALEEKEKTRRHAQTGTGRDILLQLREEHAEGSRTHYLAGPETHCGNWQTFWQVKNKVGQ